VIVSKDPLPDGWQDGTEVTVEIAPEIASLPGGKDLTDEWMDRVEALARGGDPRDDLRLEAAIAEIRRRGKESARKRVEIEP
jgi:hypothetical protein